MMPKYIGRLSELDGERKTERVFTPGSHEKFSTLGKAAAFAKGDVLAQAGFCPACCYYVLEGRVMAFEYTGTTDERYYHFNDAGSFVLEANILLGQETPISLVAVTDVKARAITREELLHVLHTDNELALELMTSLSCKFIRAMDQVREASRSNVPWKVCNLLQMLAGRYGVPYDGKILIKEKISQQMMANLLGINRVTLVRAIKELREMGFVEQINGFYCIRDEVRMQQYMENGLGR